MVSVLCTRYIRTLLYVYEINDGTLLLFREIGHTLVPRNVYVYTHEYNGFLYV